MTCYYLVNFIEASSCVDQIYISIYKMINIQNYNIKIIVKMFKLLKLDREMYQRESHSQELFSGSNFVINNNFISKLLLMDAKKSIVCPTLIYKTIGNSWSQNG